AVTVGRRQANLPVAGGGYLRFYPAVWTATALRYLNELEEKPAVVYFHPWELDPEQPRVKAPLKSRLRHYVNLSRMEGKISYLLERFRFGPFADWDQEKLAASQLKCTCAA
ncbi:MAG: DUF3473 domain-containing protein, partial [Desulfuromonadales bacterium]|nr:DUF3473 domain-containing protein [Desulfuromonadales bacterium]